MSLKNEEKAVLVDQPCRPVLAASLYLSIQTSPDTATAVSMLKTFLEEPKPVHCKTLQYVLRYIFGMTSYSLLIPTGSEDTSLEA